MLRALLLAAAVAACVLVGAHAQLVCPNGGIDADGDGVCDSGWPEVCKCGVHVGCNDNWVDVTTPGVNSANPAQRDFDCDGIGNGAMSGPPYERVLDFGADRCPFDYDPSNEDKDNDGIGKACDCDDNDAGIPRFRPCPKKTSIMLAVMLSVGFAIIFIVLLIVIIVYATRTSKLGDPILLEREIGASLLDQFWARRDAVQLGH